jgi:GNAT superfamily N-acetyltransferase
MDELEQISEAALEGIYGERMVFAGGARCFRMPEVPESRMLNRIVGLGVQREATEADIDEALAAMGETTFYVALSPGARPASLDAMLAARGLERGLGWMLFRRPPLPARPMDTRLRVVEAGSREAEAWARLVIDAFELPDTVLGWMRSIVGADGWHAWFALDGDERAAAAAVWIGGDAAYFTFAATAHGHRGKGGQNALLAARIERALELGCRTLVTETGEPQDNRPGPSYRNILRNGFVEDHVVAHRLRQRAASI